MHFNKHLAGKPLQKMLTNTKFVYGWHVLHIFLGGINWIS